jgi:hypothetical protein
MIYHHDCQRGHERACMFGDISFFLGLLTPLCVFQDHHAGMIAFIVAANAVWIACLAYVRSRQRQNRKIGKLAAKEYWLTGIIGYSMAAVFMSIISGYLALHR